MEITIQRKTLLDVIDRASGAVQKKGTVPILGHVLIEGNDKTVSVSATDLEVGIRTELSGEYDWKPGAITLSAHKLAEVLKASEADEVVIRSLDNDRIEVACGKAKFKMLGLDARSFPAMPSVQPQDDGKGPQGRLFVPARTLSEMIDRVLFAVSPDESRYNLSGVYLEGVSDAETARMVATDGHRLAIIDRPAPGFTLTKGVILPRRGMEQVRKLIDGVDGDVTLVINGNLAFLEHGDTTLSMRLVEGEFPDYSGVIPKSSKMELHVGRDPLLSAIRRVMIMSGERYRGIKFETGGGTLRLSSNTPESGEASESMEITSEAPEISIGFNGKYIEQMLAVLPKESGVVLSLSDETAPGVLTSPADELFRYILMPMRI